MNETTQTQQTTKVVKVQVEKRVNKLTKQEFNSIKVIGRDNRYYDLRFKKTSLITADKLPLGRCSLEITDVSKMINAVFPCYYCQALRVVEDDNKDKAFAIKDEDLPF